MLHMNLYIPYGKIIINLWAANCVVLRAHKKTHCSWDKGRQNPLLLGEGQKYIQTSKPPTEGV